MVAELRDSKFSKGLRVSLTSRYCQALVRISSFLCFVSSNQRSKAALSDAHEVKKGIFSFWRRLFPSTHYNFEAIFLVLTVRSFLPMASWFINFSSFVLAGVRRLILLASSDAIADRDEGTFAVSEEGYVVLIQNVNTLSVIQPLWAKPEVRN